MHRHPQAHQEALPPTHPTIQLDHKRFIDLEAGIIVNDGERKSLTPQEWQLLILLVEKWRASPHGWLATWYLIECILLDASAKDDPGHAIEQTVCNIRRKLGEKRYHPHFIISRRGRGYKLCVDEGYGFISPLQSRKV